MAEIEKYIERGLPILPVEYRGKKPHKNFQWRNAKLPAASMFDASPHPNIGLRLDSHIEVDPDDPVASRFTGLFFRDKTLVWGRKSRPGKRLYRNAEPSMPASESFKYIAPDGSEVPTIEVKAGSGHYTIIPPGTHESGEGIEWEQQPRKCAVLSIPDALHNARGVNATCLLSAYWNEGTRNALTVALTNVLTRLTNYTDDFVVDFVATIAASAGDDEDRRKQARGAVVRARQGKRMFGLPKLAEILGDRNVEILCAAFGIENLSNWETPRNILEPAGAMPSWPKDWLPGSFGVYADDIAERMQTHVEFAAVGLIASVATAAGSYCRVQPKRHDTSFQPAASVYAAVVADSGTRKTPALNDALRPIHRLQNESVKQYREALRDYEAALEAWQQADARARGERPREPVEQTIVMSEATIEAMAADLQRTPQGFMLHVDELSGLIKSFNKYRSNGQGADMEFIMSAHSGAAMNVRRRGKGGSIFLPRTYLTIVGTIQPQIVIKHLMHGEKTENGFAARFSLLLWPDPITRGYVDKEPRWDAFGEVMDKVRAIREAFTVSDEWQEPAVFRLNGAASKVYAEWSIKHDAETASLEQPLKAHWDKYQGFVAQLALIHWLMRMSMHDKPEGGRFLYFDTVQAINVEIDEVSVGAAIRLVEDVLKPHATKVYGLAAAHPGAVGAVKIARWLLRTGRAEFRIADLTKNDWAGLDSREACAPALECLELSDWIRPRVTVTNRHNSGWNRHAVPHNWLVNPRVEQFRDGDDGSETVE